MEEQVEKPKASRLSIGVFIFSLIIVLINLIFLIFPSLFPTLSGSGVDVNPFEAGAWAMWVIPINLFLLGFGILFYKKILPKKIRNALNFILNFEVSRTVTIFVMVVIVFGYIGYVLDDIDNNEQELWGDFHRVEKTVQEWPFGRVSPELDILHVKNFLLKVSLEVFDNIKIVPVLASISLLIVTYYFTVQITKKRFAGLVAATLVFQSHNFLQFDTIATYSNFWTLFYLVSLYVIHKKWYFSPISYIAAVFSKPLAAVYLPMTLFFTYRAEIPRRKKIKIAVSYVIIAGVATAAIFLMNIDVGGGITTGGLEFDYFEFWNGFTTWSFQLRFESLVLIFILPLTVGLFMTSRRGFPQADSILIILVGIILAMPLLAAISGFNLHVYRNVPVSVFFAIGVGTLFSQKIRRLA